MTITRYYVPSFLGDVSLTATGPKSCILVAEHITVAERAALEVLTKTAVKKGWCSAGTDLAKLSKTDLMAPIEKVGKLLAKALKPGRTLVTAVRFRDGRMEEMTEAPYSDDKALAKVEEPAEAVTVAKPVRGCPPPDFANAEIQATRVLNAFLSEAQREDFARFNRFITIGPDTGHRYMLTSRHNRDALANYHRQMYDLDERRPFCVHEDASVPAPEELLGLHVCLSLPGWETDLRGMDPMPIIDMTGT